MNLPEHLNVFLLKLREDARFHDVMKAIERTRLRPYVLNKDKLEDATAALVYQSGRLAGEKFIMLEVLGYDPNDRPTE